MSSLFKNLIGDKTKDRELTEQVRAVLFEIQSECARYERLVQRAQASTERIETLSEPIAKAGSDAEAVATRLIDLDQRLTGIERLSAQYQTLEARAGAVAESQERTGTEVAATLEETKQIRVLFEELKEKVDAAATLQGRLESFLEIEKPFSILHDEAETLRDQVGTTGEQLARLREQHDRLLDAHKQAMGKVESLEKRRDELGRSLQDKERRIVLVEESARGIDSVRNRADDVRREMGTLKALTDFVAQKTAQLEAQRDATDRALVQAAELERAMRQIDAGAQKQMENEKTFRSLQDQVAGLRSLHEAVLERSGEISQLQREIDERTQAARQELAAAAEETRKSIERFDFERSAVESVTQRVVDLRSSLADAESRFKGLGESRVAVREIDAQTQSLVQRVSTIAADLADVDQEIVKLTAIRRDLENAGRATREIGAQVERIEQARPSIDAVLRDLERVSGAHAIVKDAVEQAEVAHGELARMRAAQSETRDWLVSVEKFVGELREQSTDLRAMAPHVERLHERTQTIGDAVSSIEGKRAFVEDLERRIADLESVGIQLDERGRELAARMEAAEKRFAGLEEHSDKAEHMTVIVGKVSASLSAAGSEAEEIKKTVVTIREKAESVEELAEQTRAMKAELDQRKNAIAESAKELKRAAALREEASTAAQQLEELSKRLTASIANADKRATKVDELAAQLEDRGANLKLVEKKMTEFEERVSQWDALDQEMSRSLEHIASRQGTVASLRGDLERMLSMADQTAASVREIAEAHAEIEQSRKLLHEVGGRVREIREATSTIEERKRQMAKAEERLARAEGLLVDVRSSVEALQEHKAIVDQAVEKAGSLQFLVKQAETTIEGLREERRTSERVRAAAFAGQDDDEEDAKAA